MGWYKIKMIILEDKYKNFNEILKRLGFCDKDELLIIKEFIEEELNIK